MNVNQNYIYFFKDYIIVSKTVLTIFELKQNKCEAIPYYICEHPLHNIKLLKSQSWQHFNPFKHFSKLTNKREDIVLNWSYFKIIIKILYRKFQVRVQHGMSILLLWVNFIGTRIWENATFWSSWVSQLLFCSTSVGLK